MKSFFKGMFGSREKQGNRKLTSPDQLQQNDMLKLDDSFGLPAQIRGITFRVIEVAASEYEEGLEKEWLLEGENGFRAFLSIDREDGVDKVGIGMKFTRNQVEAVFDMDQFAGVFDGETAAELTSINQISEVDGWIGKRYYQIEKGVPGYHFKQVPETDTSGRVLHGDGEQFDYYALVSDCEKYGIDIEVWDGGATDVAAYIYQPISVIRELWPGEG